MRTNTRSQEKRSRQATRSARPALDPYCIDEVGFTREEILRSRADL